ncbi:MAG: isocitrate/isopropylmalate dehydrogenase family protein [Candidatus Latescibacterota bacterium]
MSGRPSVYEIAVLGGDGIGPEVVEQAVEVLQQVAGRCGMGLRFTDHPCGADCYLKCGTPLPAATLEACRAADAVLLGAMGRPDVRWPDGTEMRPQIDLRFQLDLYAGVRPIYLYAAEHTPLKGLGPGDIDLVILRENVEGLFASMNGGIELRGEVAVDSMVITRSGTERVVRFAFELARRRGRQPMKVTCVDKANVLRSMAFFRRIFDSVAASYPDVEREHAYVDALALHLVRRPASFDVLVMENMYGDITSDLAAGLVGGMGMAPSADIGEQAGVFQPSHGTAPDIAGLGVANPVATILSAAMMLDWFADRHGDAAARQGAQRIGAAVRQVLETPGTGTPDLGGRMTTQEMGKAVAGAV